MSAEDCILYRKIKEDWFVIPYGLTWQDDISDAEFSELGFLVPEFVDVFIALEVLNSVIVNEHGICYAGDYHSDAPPEVPPEHRVLLMPDDQR